MLALKEAQTDTQNMKLDESRPVTSKLVWFGEALRSHTQVGFPPQCSWTRRTTAVPYVTKKKNRLKCQHFSFDSLKIHAFSGFEKVLATVSKKRLSTTSCVSVRRSAWNNSAPTGRTFVKFYWKIFRTFVQDFQVSLKPEKNKRYFTWMAMYVYDNI